MTEGTSASAPTIHICWTEPHYEAWRRSIGERWCFKCRKRCDFEHIRTVPAEMSYYGPSDRIECTACRTVDGDLFPGRVREYE